MEDIDQYVQDVSNIRSAFETIVSIHVDVCAVGNESKIKADKVMLALS